MSIEFLFPIPQLKPTEIWLVLLGLNLILQASPALEYDALRAYGISDVFHPDVSGLFSQRGTVCDPYAERFFFSSDTAQERKSC